MFVLFISFFFYCRLHLHPPLLSSLSDYKAQRETVFGTGVKRAVNMLAGRSSTFSTAPAARLSAEEEYWSSQARKVTDQLFRDSIKESPALSQYFGDNFQASPFSQNSINHSLCVAMCIMDYSKKSNPVDVSMHNVNDTEEDSCFIDDDDSNSNDASGSSFLDDSDKDSEDASILLEE